MKYTRYHLRLAVAGWLAAVGGLAASADSAFPFARAASAREPDTSLQFCPGPPPPPTECMEVYCEVGDDAWAERPRPAGWSCQQVGRCDGQGNCVLPTPPPGPSDKAFYIKPLGGRCVDFGGEAFWRAGAPVFVHGCNGSAAQHVRIKEIADGTHDVELRVRDLFCIGTRGGPPSPGRALELQQCNGSAAQRFAIDGDAILMGSQASGRASREYVIELEQGRTANHTPLVVGARDVTDAEYFRFEAVDGGAGRPHTGFVKVVNDLTLDAALARGWGTVIEVDDTQRVVLTGRFSRRINAGVTLRGYRKHTYQGPEMLQGLDLAEPAFVIDADNVRVTGLRLRGRQDFGDGQEASAIDVASDPGGADRRVLLDHLDIGYWTGSAIGGAGGERWESCPAGFNPWPRVPTLRAVGNFLHHNDAYGVVSGNGAFVLAQGNVAYQHAHDIAADPWGTTGYAAYDNLVLTPVSGGHDFDVHGSGNPGHWFDGIAGDRFDIGWNTFLPTGHPNFVLRGTPCRFVSFHDNVTQQSQGDAIRDQSAVPGKIVFAGNRFGSPHPISDFGVGDFDGDGLDDMFVGTGAGWYFSSGGRAEWRFLSRKPERAANLRFGDFDGDGRTDVLQMRGTAINVSWAGVSAWLPLNSAIATLADLAVGDFDGDGRADVFLADGTRWQIAPGGGGAWAHFATSTFRTSQLRFGRFDGDNRTDVLGVVSGQWQMVPGNGSQWTPLRSALTTSLTGLIVADFDGDGISDVAGSNAGIWRYSPNARGGWVTLRNSSEGLAGKPVGQFDGAGGADVIVLNGLQWDYAASGRNPLVRLSRQMMR
jgi:hypothetical protein